jgi:MEMO1 family protein
VPSLADFKFQKRSLFLGCGTGPRGAAAAIFPSGAWRTPLGDAPIDTGLAADLGRPCPLLKQDEVAHSREHSLEVQLPFLQVLAPDLSFVPIALGTVPYDSLIQIGEALGGVIHSMSESVLLVTTSDLNHYQDDSTTRTKDRMAIEKLLAQDPRGLYQVCKKEDISMCGLGPAVAMLTALGALGARKAELVKYATSADVSGDQQAVVGYAGIIFA